MKITIHNESILGNTNYAVDLSRRFEGHEPGDLICYASPWLYSGIPLRLEIAIRKNGDLAFRSWDFCNDGDPRLQTNAKCASDIANDFERPFVPTQEQIDTVNGLFSGRIAFDGLKLAPGATLQKICPIDVAAEEARIGKKIYLA